MKIIELHHPYHTSDLIQEPIVLALGFFDGVHLGHQEVIRQARIEADKRGVKLAVLTFNQHPKLVYGKLSSDELKYLTTNERKATLFEQFGVDILYLMDFTYEFGTQTPQEFVDRYIVGLNAVVVVAGYDYTYGKAEIANMQTLPLHAKGRFEMIEVSQLTYGAHRVGSTRLRDLITQGNIEEANRELGYVYETTGIVVHGEKRGRTIGYPTANIQTSEHELLLGKGIYIVEFWVDGQWYKGMASIGYNVTFETDTGLTCEVYVLDFSRMIYGEKVKVRWHKHLRDEIKFTGVEALVAQLDQDQLATRAYFATKGE